MFGTSDALGGAYGIAVSLLMAITTVLAALVALQWGFPLWMVAAVNGGFLVIDLTFVAANSIKLFEGGWFPLLLASLVAFLMLTWRNGVQQVETARSGLRQAEGELVGTVIDKCKMRLPGTAIFLSSSRHDVPLTLTQFVRHTHVLHAQVLLVTLMIEELPRIADADRADVTPVADGVTRLILHYGFMQHPSIPRGLRVASEQNKLPGIDLAEATYYFGHETIVPTRKIPGMMVWREAVFAFMQRNAERSAAYYDVPTSQVMEVGTELEI
jgi:KUP system potassium uptake protein